MGPLVNADHEQILNRPYIVDEVKKSRSDITVDKSLRPDGFGSHLFKDVWSIVGNYITLVFLDIFSTGKLLRELNVAVLNLIPKLSSLALLWNLDL